MRHTVQPISFKPHNLNGLSEQPMIQHYQDIYGSDVQRANAIEAQLAAIDRANLPADFDVSRLKRNQLLTLNSMKLHEVYFDSLGGSGEPEGAFADALTRDFGSVTDWRAEFTAMAKALSAQQRSGWVVLSLYSPLDRARLINQWTADGADCLAGAAPVLAIDLYEHAYCHDFGTDVGAYVEAFMSNVHWTRVANRYSRLADSIPATDTATTPASSQTTVDALLEQVASQQPMQVLDVRLRDDMARAHHRIPDTDWRDPEQVAEWADGLDKSKPVVVYCMYGFWVSQDASAALRERGFDAHTLAGGMAAWKASGAPTEALENQSEETTAAL